MLFNASLVLALAGIVLALCHVVVSTPSAIRHGGVTDPAFFPWIYIGGGLLVSGLGFLFSRILSQGSLGALPDLVGITMVLAVASWGFGSGFEWLQSRKPVPVPWFGPLLLSLVLGLVLGFSSIPA